MFYELSAISPLIQMIPQIVRERVGTVHHLVSRFVVTTVLSRDLR